MNQSSKTTESQTFLDLANSIPDYDPFKVTDKYIFIPEKQEGKGNECLGFFDHYLTHAKGALAGEPFSLEVWQKAILINVFGWFNRETGFRRYREAFVYVPRKNGKTTLAAGVALYGLFCDGEKGAEIYSAAADREQAALVFDAAKVMVEQDSDLRENSSTYTKSITLDSMHSVYKAISADASTKHGYNTHIAIIDELHAQKNRDLVDVLITSTGARDQPLVMYITTADYDRESICNEKLDYAKKVRDGIIDDPTFLPVIYEADVKDDWTDPKVWIKSNPNIDISVSREYLEKECKKAQESLAYQGTFRRLHLNIKTETRTAWLDMSKWRGCECNTTEEQLLGLSCYGGLDLSNTQDITALVLAFPIEDKYRLICRFWMPAEGAAERIKRHSIPYDVWERTGQIIYTPEKTVDYRFIRQEINDLSREYDIQEIAFDPWNATATAKQLRDEDGFDMIEMRQGTYTMNEPSKAFEKLIIDGRLDHGNNPVLTWMASNVSIIQDPLNNIKPVKNADHNKIDGIVAAVMAVARAIFTEKTNSVYEGRGILSI